MNYIKF